MTYLRSCSYRIGGSILFPTQASNEAGQLSRFFALALARECYHEGKTRAHVDLRGENQAHGGIRSDDSRRGRAAARSRAHYLGTPLGASIARDDLDLGRWSAPLHSLRRGHGPRLAPESAGPGA